MAENKKQQWFDWLSSLQAITQNGLAYTENPFDIERYQQMQKIIKAMFADLTALPEEAIGNIFAKESGYATPKLDVRAAIFKDQQILLVKERSDGLWTLPGGWADVNESAAEAVVKEVREETGYIVKANKLLALYDKHKHDHPPQWPHAYKAFFLCEIIGGAPQDNLEIAEIAFFDKTHLPALSEDRVTKSQILRMYQYLENPDLATDFD